MNSQIDSKGIVKNTIYLYLRMLLLLVISLITSRIVFQKLGASDFGLYNVVAGFVVMLSFLNGAMGNATQRFLSYELAKKDIPSLKIVFCQIQILHIIIAAIVVLLAETVGLWFINYKLNIPEARYTAANVIYQAAIISTVCSIISVPYNAILISRENMKFYAYMGLLEGFLKFLVCSLLFIPNTDRLVIYGISLSVVSVFIRIVYWHFCNRYEETHFKYIIDKSRLRDVASFASWSLCGSISTTANSEGINVLINLFFNTLINAARGIAYQVDGVVRNFVINFQTAMNPQIVKSFSLGEFGNMYELIYKGSKLSFYILYSLAIPVIFNLNYLLKLWLGTLPIYTVIFTKLVLINSLIVSLSGVLSLAAQSTGKIKKYQLTMGGGILLNLPLAYVFFRLGFPPYYVLVISIIIETILLFTRLFFLKKMINLPVLQYIAKSLFPVLMVVVITLPIIYFEQEIPDYNNLFLVLTKCLAICLTIVIMIFYFGISKDEKNKIIKIIKTKIYGN